MRVLVYGDSNSWGQPPDGSGLRMARTWPLVMAEALGAETVTDALPGRTTAQDDPGMARSEPAGAAWNGLAHLEAAMMAASPLDLVVIMLGTNDFKTRFAPNPGKIAASIMSLADLASRVPAGPGSWLDETPPRVALICPQPLGPRADDPAWERYEEWRGGRAVSLGLHAALAPLAAARGIAVFEAGSVVQASAQDPIHLDPGSHAALGRAVADWLRALA